MISHKHKIIFVHIPKCAGTSIEKVLGHHSIYDGRGKQGHRTIRHIEPVNIMALSSMNNFKMLLRKLKYYFKKHLNQKNSYTCNRQQFDDYFKFTFVRNPWDRVFSAYKSRGKNYRLNGKYISFKQFVLYFMKKDGLCKPVGYFLTNYNGKIELDYIGKFESLDSDFKKICDEVGLKNITLPHLVKSKSKNNYRQMYDDETKSLVADYFANEIKTFNYKF